MTISKFQQALNARKRGERRSCSACAVPLMTGESTDPNGRCEDCASVTVSALPASKPSAETVVPVAPVKVAPPKKAASKPAPSVKASVEPSATAREAFARSIAAEPFPASEARNKPAPVANIDAALVRAMSELNARIDAGFLAIENRFNTLEFSVSSKHTESTQAMQGVSARITVVERKADANRDEIGERLNGLANMKNELVEAFKGALVEIVRATNARVPVAPNGAPVAGNPVIKASPKPSRINGGTSHVNGSASSLLARVEAKPATDPNAPSVACERCETAFASWSLAARAHKVRACGLVCSDCYRNEPCEPDCLGCKAGKN